MNLLVTFLFPYDFFLFFIYNAYSGEETFPISCRQLCSSPALISVPVTNTDLPGMDVVVKRQEQTYIGQDSSFRFSDLVVSDGTN